MLYTQKYGNLVLDANKPILLLQVLQGERKKKKKDMALFYSGLSNCQIAGIIT